ncbi:MAG: cation transporter [Acutalibacteraceae bacterium]
MCELCGKMENAISKLEDVENVSISFMTTKMVLKADEDKMDAVIGNPKNH